MCCSTRTGVLTGGVSMVTRVEYIYQKFMYVILMVLGRSRGLKYVFSYTRDNVTLSFKLALNNVILLIKSSFNNKKHKTRDRIDSLVS